MTDAAHSFYRDLTSFTEFTSLAEDAQFKPAPGSWLIAITDVKNSTGAIADGRYRDVNTIGAAAIVAVSNALGGEDYPFVFGGDGATCLVPASAESAVRTALLGLKTMARAQFAMELRIGLIPVNRVLKDGVTVDVGKYELTAGRCVALFRGGGLIRAEELLKSQPDQFEVGEESTADVNLRGLSCRWNSVPSRQGRVVSLLVRSRLANHVALYGAMLGKLSDLVGGHLSDAEPVNLQAMTYKSVGQCVRDERRYHRSVFSVAFAKRVFEILISVLAFKRGLALFDVEHYRKAMATHSDCRKFDDMLRLVLDCTPQQVTAIRSYLESLHEQGLVFYGLHEADTSLMTCFVGTVADGGHIHFIDGGDGGYATAAVQMKAQIKSALGK